MAKKLKQSHFCFYLRNRPLKSGLEVIYTPFPQNPSGSSLFHEKNPKARCEQWPRYDDGQQNLC